MMIKLLLIQFLSIPYSFHHCILVLPNDTVTFQWLSKVLFLSSSSGHIRDPNNQLQVVKNLRICVNNVATSPNTASAALSPSQRRLLNEVVLSCQPQEGAVTNVIVAGDYDLNFSGKDQSSNCTVVLRSMPIWIFEGLENQKTIYLPKHNHSW